MNTARYLRRTSAAINLGGRVSAPAMGLVAAGGSGLLLLKRRKAV
ncbi:MAG: LPXTG cell wall anchor domain-containing protein [Phycisphaerae bacterium]